jgi:hypothetical protein
MNATIRKYTPALALAVLMLFAVLCVIYPYYQYYVDPDGTAYLTISKRYADGDFLKAINGYWSPWSCWLTAASDQMRSGSLFQPPLVINALAANWFLAAYLNLCF